jgi:hypothetical protein
MKNRKNSTIVFIRGGKEISRTICGNKKATMTILASVHARVIKEAIESLLLMKFRTPFL